MIDVQPVSGSATVSLDRASVQGNVLGGVAGAQGLLMSPAPPAPSRIADSLFAHNALGDDGPGAVHIAPGAGGATLTVTRSQFDANTAGADGAGRGAALAFGPGGGGSQSMSVTDSSFTNNVAGALDAGAGGAIDFSGAPGVDPRDLRQHLRLQPRRPGDRLRPARAAAPWPRASAPRCRS